MGQSNNTSRRLPSKVVVTFITGLLMALPITASAADAHIATKAKPGEIVLIRNVPARVAYRTEPPARALIVNTSPRSEVAAALGTEELSDADYAGINSTSANGDSIHRTTVERMVTSSLGGSVGLNGSRTTSVSSNGISNVVSGPMGAVGSTTRGIGNQVQSALAQLPGMMPTSSAAGH